MQILHLSMPKTGSLSMKEAYKILGIELYHGFDYTFRPEDQIEWEKAVDAKFYGKGKPFTRKDFDAFLGQWDGLSDYPAIGFSEELLEAYPEAKVVLVERDVDSWFRTFASSVVRVTFGWQGYVLENYVDIWKKAKPATTIRKLQAAMFDCSDRETLLKNAKGVYREHYANLRRIVPKDRLLDYRLGSGWEPLCEFLGKPIPDVEFPHMNESKEFKVWQDKAVMREMKAGLMSFARGAIIPLAILGVAMAIKKIL